LALCSFKIFATDPVLTCKIYNIETQEYTEGKIYRPIYTAEAELKVDNTLVGKITFKKFMGINKNRFEDERTREDFSKHRTNKKYDDYLEIEYVDNFKQDKYKLVGTALMAEALENREHSYISSASFYKERNLNIPESVVRKKLVLYSKYSAIGFYKKLGFELFDYHYQAESAVDLHAKDKEIFKNSDDYAHSKANAGIWLILNDESILRAKALEQCNYQAP
jgi:hypothetical protein